MTADRDIAAYTRGGLTPRTIYTRSVGGEACLRDGERADGPTADTVVGITFLQT